MKQTVSVLGSTGSVGRQTLSVCEQLSLPISAMTTHTSIFYLEQQARRYRPKFVAAYDAHAARMLKIALADTDIRVGSGMEGLIDAAVYEGTDTVVTAVSGSVGLLPTLSAIDAGIQIALANKETLVCAGDIVMQRAKEKQVSILPVDSEHSAIFQCLAGNEREDLSHILLTASGGPFRGKRFEEIKDATPEVALRHPNWDMGAKISIDSATMMNKGLEMIEAMHLFSVTAEEIEILIHPESIIHSMVAYRDGAVIAQLGVPDMALPIAYALTYPRREKIIGQRLDLFTISMLRFERPDLSQLPCLRLAIESAKMGGTAPAVMSAANEAAVAAFLDYKIPFGEISACIEAVLDSIELDKAIDLDTIMQADAEARAAAREYIQRK